MKEREAYRALRSFNYNRDLKPKVDFRLERARDRLKSYLMLNGTNSMRLGRYQVDLIEDQLHITKLPPEGWEQRQMKGFAHRDAQVQAKE